MTNQNQKKQDEGKGGISPMAAAVTGAVIGAGAVVAGAVAIALEDKKNREKVKKTFTNVKKQAVSYMKDMQKQAQDKKGEIEEKLIEDKRKVRNITSSVKGSLQQAVKDAKKAANKN